MLVDGADMDEGAAGEDGGEVRLLGLVDHCRTRIFSPVYFCALLLRNEFRCVNRRLRTPVRYSYFVTLFSFCSWYRLVPLQT